MKKTKKTMGLSVVVLLLFLTLLAVLVYLSARIAFFFFFDYHWYEKVAAGALLLAELFILTHSLGYFLNVLLSFRKNKEPVQTYSLPVLDSYPPTAVVVASYHEPLDILEDTLTCFFNLTYPNKHLVFLDDTRYDLAGANPEEMSRYRQAVDDLCRNLGINLFRRQWRGAKAGIINDFNDFLAKRPKGGFEFTAYSEKPLPDDVKYLIVFDADQNPFPDFIEPLAARMESDPKLAFVQTPQYYSNFEHNRVARGAGLQQAVFYEYICEGKSISDAMFCCGTNVIFRRQALEDVGGFDEDSVTEDIVTSFKFHQKGWRSSYMNKICAFGMGPEDLGGYFKQQFRWALGTVGLARRMLLAFLHRPLSLPFSKWWEYFLSGTHYFVGWAFFIMIYCPVLYLLLGVPSYFVQPEIYFLVFAPYMVLSISLFIWTLGSRRYGLLELFMGQMLIGASFPVFMKASFLGIMGFKGKFRITPKSGGDSLPLLDLWPQVLTAMLCLAAMVVGGLKLYFEPVAPLAVAVNIFWCSYHLFIVSTAVFYFNRPTEAAKK
ncbi:MAG: glycosyltransferase family 2 protein [Pseudomonadota bacterium]